MAGFSRKAITKVQAAIVVVVIVAAAIIAIYFTLPAPTAPPKKVTIEMQWVACPEADMCAKTAEYWNEHYAEKTGIEVKITILSFLGYFDKLTTQLIAGGPTPDIVEAWSYYVGQYSPYIEPLDDYFENPELFSSPDGEPYNLDDMYPLALETGQYKGKTYFLMHSDVHLTLMYREDLIPKAPETWDEFLALARQHSKSVNPDSETTYGVAIAGRGPIDTTTWKTWLSIYWSYGGTYFKPGTFEPDFDNEAGLKAVELYSTLVKEELVPPDVTSYAFLEVMSAMQSGEVAMILDWQPIFVTLADPDASPLIHDKVAHAPPPGVKQADGSIKRYAYKGYNVVGINKNSKYKEQAFKFLSWYLFGEGMMLDVEQGNTPANRIPYEDSSIRAEYGWIQKALDLQLPQVGRPEPSYVDLPTVQGIGAGTMSSILSGLDPKAGIEALQRETWDLLKSKGYF